ncbi:FISUMP domain-containing protein [Fibrobacter succinogenes]|uniref:FISUMP domain-containing protein n=1 Tax=Fibrobacter succinogenes TaxID=833 RepID=UPI001569683B|nr:FISUMP domain-containing protein [Fibrobacter succinogenes]
MNFKNKALTTSSIIAIAVAVFLAGCDEENISQPPLEVVSPSSDSEISSSSASPESSVASSEPSSSVLSELPSSSSLSESSSSAPQSSAQAPETKVSSSSTAPSSARTNCITYTNSFDPDSYNEDPECVIRQLTAGVVENLVKQGIDSTSAFNTAKLKLYSIFSLDTLLQHQSLHSTSIGYTFSHLIPPDNDSSKTRSDFIEKFTKGETIDETFICSAYEGFSIEKFLSIINPTSTWGDYGRYSTNYAVQEPQYILRNLWRHCGQLPYCDSSHYELFKTYRCSSDKVNCKDNGKDFVCAYNSWRTPNAKEYETHDKECTANNTRFPSDSFPSEFYICYEGRWYLSRDNLVDSLPQEYFFNENIKYDTLTDPRDGKKYRTVVFENQVWMAENINYYSESDSLIKNFSKCAQKIGCRYGRFYNVDAATHACPEGWHLPKEADVSRWDEMPYAEATVFLPKLFSRLTGERGATNESGLSLLSINSVDPYGWDHIGVTYGYFWVDPRKEFYIATTHANFSDVDPREKGQFLPVRCIKDN